MERVGWPKLSELGGVDGGARQTPSLDENFLSTNYILERGEKLVQLKTR